MVRKKDRFWEYVEQLDKGFRCKFCKREFPGGIPRIKPHLAGLKGRGIDICKKVPEDVQATARLEIGGSCKKSKTAASSNNLQANHSDSTSSGNLSNGFYRNVNNKGMEVDEKLTKFILLNSLSLDIVESKPFTNFVNSVARFGPDYKLPSTLTLESKVVPDLEMEVETYLKNVKESWVKTGCTIIVNKFGRLCSLIISSPKGSVFCHLCYSFYGTWNLSKIQDIVDDNVVQLIYNDEEVLNDLYMHVNKRICIIPCVAHKLHILLHYIVYDVSWVDNTIEDAKMIVDYIFDNKTALLLMRKYMKNRELKYPCVAKFSYYQMLQSMFDNKEQLRQLVSSAEWGTLNETWIVDKIQSNDFWYQVEEVLNSLQPIIQVLGLVEDDRATSGYLYEAMQMAKEAILTQYNNKKEKYGRILEIFKEEEKDIIHPIHAAAAFLNPAYMRSKNFKADLKMEEGISFVLDTFVVAEEEQQFMKEVELYREKMSGLFTKRAMVMLETLNPWKWWDCCGDSLPVLQKYAIRILSQPCKSSFIPEYSIRDVILSKEIIEAQHGTWKELVLGRMNIMMMERFRAMEERSLDSIDITKCNQLPDYVDSREIRLLCFCSEKAVSAAVYAHQKWERSKRRKVRFCWTLLFLVAKWFILFRRVRRICQLKQLGYYYAFP